MRQSFIFCLRNVKYADNNYQKEAEQNEDYAIGMNLPDCTLILVRCVSIRMTITSNALSPRIAKKVKGTMFMEDSY